MIEPGWMVPARAKIGIREAPGAANNPTIMGWVKTVGARVIGMAYSADSIPWCGLFVAQCVTEVGLKPPGIAVRAKSWATWGDACQPQIGCILVFSRDGGGHVGFYVSESTHEYCVLGGNQGDAVSFTWIPKDRCIAVRWPKGAYQHGGRTFVTRSAGKTTTSLA